MEVQPDDIRSVDRATETRAVQSAVSQDRRMGDVGVQSLSGSSCEAVLSSRQPVSRRQSRWVPGRSHGWDVAARGNQGPTAPSYTRNLIELTDAVRAHGEKARPSSRSDGRKLPDGSVGVHELDGELVQRRREWKLALEPCQPGLALERARYRLALSFGTKDSDSNVLRTSKGYEPLRLRSRATDSARQGDGIRRRQGRGRSLLSELAGLELALLTTSGGQARRHNQQQQPSRARCSQHTYHAT